MAKTTQNSKPEPAVAAKPAARPVKVVKSEEQPETIPAVLKEAAIEAVENDSQETDASGKKKPIGTTKLSAAARLRSRACAFTLAATKALPSTTKLLISISFPLNSKHY